MTASRQANDRAGSRSGTDTVPDPRLEPLLWLQLLGIGAIPAEGLALLLLLGSVDPGPLPGLERLLIWALGVLAPAMVLWQRPADCWSLLLLQAPLRGRRELQRRLSRLQEAAALKGALVAGAALLLPAIWILDQAGGLATGFSPLTGSSRLVVLLLSIPLLAVILWQWQQLLQALWLLSRPGAAVLQAAPLTPEELEQTRLSIGLPVLLINPLQAAAGTEQTGSRKASEPATSEPASTKPATPEPATTKPATPEPAAPSSGGAATGGAAPGATVSNDTATHPAAPAPTEPSPEAPAQCEVNPEAQAPPEVNPEPLAQPEADLEASGSVAIEPEQAAGDAQGGHLNQQIVDLDT